MRTAVTAMAVAMIFTTPAPVAARPNLYEVHGVEDGEMLKMRSGVGTGYRVIVGLPNGAIVRIQKCEASGAVQWCRVALEEARSLVGWVSMSYLKERR